MIAKDILKKLNHPISGYNNDGMIGMDRHIKQLQSLLLLESQTVRMIGIWGMGGIGKTTIAKAIFEKLTTQFSSRSIIIDVQEEIKRHGLSAVKSKYLSQLLEKNNTSIESNFLIVPSRLKWTKSLIVFDDVKESKQLEYLIGTHENFGPGSRIIVTSRDKKVLENANADEIYPVSEMDDHDSLQLFCLFAFKQNHPEESFVSLTEKVLDYAKGLPLALNVLGSFLKGKTKQAWESELQTLKKHLNGDIFDVLKLCYDGLDDFQKDIFLDIACFHRGELEKFVEQTLNCYYGLSTRTRMNALEDRCLISISKGRVWMHDLIREMGHKIVRDQWKYPERRSRLWNFNDIYDVFGKNKVCSLLLKYHLIPHSIS
ncbi:disease resistance protein RPV1 [Trifolium repens]|nr:disease resistance protein RPV1 [Trifolium repens]